MMTMLVVGIVLATVGYGGWKWMEWVRQSEQPENPDQVRQALLRLQADDATLPTLSVTYHDLHGFHGGLILTVHGDGRIEQQAVRTQVGTLKAQVQKSDLRRMVELLVDLAAWQQRVPSAMPIPDESRAHLKIVLEGQHSLIWERYNDLASGKRIIQVRELLKQIAWQHPS